MSALSFSYDGLFSKRSLEVVLGGAVKHAKYDFAVAYPDPETIPLAGLERALHEGLAREGKNLAYYPHQQGLPELRELISAKLERDRGFTVAPDEIVLTNGSGEANFLVIQALTNPGDTVLTEEYVYSGTLSQIRRAGANVVGTPLDDEGIVPDALDDLIERLTDEGNKPKYLYTIPEFQNPTGSVLPGSRRERILEICHRHGMPLLEDDCYVDLRYEGDPQPAFRSIDDSGIVNYVASFSKILAPGLRLGYFTASEPVLKRAMSFRPGSGPNQFAALAVLDYLKAEMYQHISDVTSALVTKRDAMVSTLGESFGGTGTAWSRPPGGLYVWVTFPEQVDVNKLQPIAFAAGVGFSSGANFAPNNNGDHCARLCFGYESPQKNREGISLLADVMEREGAFRVAPGD